MQTTIVLQFRAYKCGLLIMLTTFTAFLFSCSGTAQDDVQLDGRAFTVLTIPNGNPAEAAMESITFKEGRFDNDNCHLWGFGDAPYTASREGDSIVFTATTTSPKEGSMTWKGTIKDETLHGTMTWSKQGQADLNYTFSNGQIELADLNGKSFDVQFTDADTTTTETITFTDGYFESPGCYTWGFSRAPYDAYILDGVTHFQSLYTSEQEGKMLFYGVIQSGMLSGTQFWTKEGQADMYYQMRGEER